MFIESNNPDINVDELIEVIHQEVINRQFSSVLQTNIENSSEEKGLIVSNLNKIEILLNTALINSQVPSELPQRLNTFPFNISIVRKIILKIYWLIFKKQRIVDSNLILALREIMQINQQLVTRLEVYEKNLFQDEGIVEELVKNILLKQHLIFGDSKRLKLSETCIVNNALFNLSCGSILIGEHVFFGHNVSVITGTHDYNKFGLERMDFDANQGNDIVIEEGAWIASNVTLIGPCIIGKHSVVAAGAVVKSDVPSYHIVAGVPAKTVKQIAIDK
jgi:acetyltransferase-like isoleucine patch superfamily enzyme